MKKILMVLFAVSVSACAYGPQRSYDYDDRYGKDRYESGGPGDAVVCHKGKKTMTLPESALGGHLGHGDYRGPCRLGNPRDRRSFNERDTNNDDRLSFSEFGGDRATFNRLDRNNDGLLIRVEFYNR